MNATVSEWLNLLLRWLHVVAGIYWVGQTYLFAWLDGRFAAAERAATSDADTGVWMVHSGGFYRVEKLTRPDPLPRRLYWTRWESALTWGSGVLLLFLVYYMGGMLVPRGAALTNAAAAAIGLGSLLAGWIVYDLLWVSPLARHERTAEQLSFLLLAGVAWLLTATLSGRAAFIHVGALMGTVMAANVWVRILPAQRQMIASIRDSSPLDPLLARRAKQRSKHNGFLAIPVVLIMISNHFPTVTYGHRYNGAVLAILILAGWAARYALKAFED